MTAKRPPKIENAPGLTWKIRKHGWEARWQARSDIVRRGWNIKSMRLWHGEELTPIDVAFIQDRCNALQGEMLVFARGGIPQTTRYDGTLSGLIRCYMTDADSSFRKLRYPTRRYYEKMFDIIERIEWTEDGITKTAGETQIADIKARLLLKWHRNWHDQGKTAMGHAVMGMFRIVAGFGSTILEDSECERLSGVLSNMRFPMAKPRTVNLTADQANEIRKFARANGYPGVAYAQAFQFELMLRQKDVIGEWVPLSEPGLSDTIYGNNKWLRGIRWEEIDNGLILTHTTSKRQKEIRVDLRMAQMVMDELRTDYGQNFTRADLPAAGPIVLGRHGRPFEPQPFRDQWRKAANAAGVPANVRNMDSRAGAITEATDAGVPLEHVRISATHSDIGMTQKYSRGDQEKVASVMQSRLAHRQNKRQTGDN